MSSRATPPLRPVAGFLWSLFAIAIITSAAPAVRADAGRPADAARTAVAHKAAIASAYPLASQAGEEILKEGGNAFDAAVAVAAALSVVEPTSSGLGGGGFFLLHRQSDGFESMVDAREKAPGAASRDMYLDKAGNEIPNSSTSGPRHRPFQANPLRSNIWRANMASCR